MTKLGTVGTPTRDPNLEEAAKFDLLAEALIREAKRLQRKRRLIAGLVAIVLVGGVLFGILTARGGLPPTSTPAPGVGRAPRSVVPKAGVHDATTAYVVDAAGLVPIDLSNDKAAQTIAIPGFSFSGSYSNVAVAPDGKTAYVVTSPIPSGAGVDLPGPALVTIDLLTRQVVSRISFSASALRPGQDGPVASFYIDALAITPDGRTLLVADAGDETLIPVDAASKQVGRPIELPSERPANSLISGYAGPSYSPRSPAPITDVVVDPDGRTAYVVDGDAVVPVNLVDGRSEEPITGFDGPQQMAISPDGATAYVTNPYCWEIFATGQCEPPPPHPITEPNGRIQLAAVGDHVSVVNLIDHRIVRSIDVGETLEPEGVALLPSGSTLYLTYGKYSTHGQFVAMVDARTGQTIARISDGLASSNAGSDQIAVTPNGTEAFVSGFEVVTGGGPSGPDVFRGVVPIDLLTRDAAEPISFGAPVPTWLSTGTVIFGQ